MQATKVNSDGRCLAQQLCLFNTVFYCDMFRLISIPIFRQFLSQYKIQFIMNNATNAVATATGINCV